MNFTLQAYEKILKYLLLRVDESKPPNSFSIMEDLYLIFFQYYGRFISSEMILVPLIDRGTGKGHLRSCDVINRFVSIYHDMMALKTCKWYQTAHLVMARRLVCSMTIHHNLIGE